MGINYEELFNNSYSRITQEIKAIGSSPILCVVYRQHRRP